MQTDPNEFRRRPKLSEDPILLLKDKLQKINPFGYSKGKITKEATCTFLRDNTEAYSLGRVQRARNLMKLDHILCITTKSLRTGTSTI